MSLELRERGIHAVPQVAGHPEQTLAYFSSDEARWPTSPRWPAGSARPGRIPSPFGMTECQTPVM